MGFSGTERVKIVTGDAGYVLEDVRHSSDSNPDLPWTVEMATGNRKEDDLLFHLATWLETMLSDLNAPYQQ